MRCVAVLLAAAALGLAARAGTSSPVQVEVASDAFVFTTLPRFLSWTMDAGCTGRWGQMKDSFWNNKLATALAKQLGPSFLRYGGTAEDMTAYNFSGPAGFIPPRTPRYLTLNATVLKGITDFASRAGWSTLFSTNVGTYRTDPGNAWDPRAFSELLSYVQGANVPIAGWELGNEPDLFDRHNISVTPEQLGEDFLAYRAFLNEHGERDSPVIGPDVADNVDFFSRVLATGGDGISFATYHFYYGPGSSKPHGIPWQDFSTPALMDKYLGAAVKFANASRAWREGKPGERELWVGETSSTYGGGTANASASFVAGFLWVDKLAIAARTGHSVLCRQVFGHAQYSAIGNDNLPNPDYWSALLWRRLVGPRVLAVAGDMDTGRAVRTYAFCTADTTTATPTAAAPGSVTIVYLNTQPTTTAELDINLPGPRNLYALTSYPGLLISRSVYLNGRVLEVDPASGAVTTPLDPQPVPAGQPVPVPPVSYGYVVLPDAQAKGCL